MQSNKSYTDVFTAASTDIINSVQKIHQSRKSSKLNSQIDVINLIEEHETTSNKLSKVSKEQTTRILNENVTEELLDDKELKIDSTIQSLDEKDDTLEKIIDQSPLEEIEDSSEKITQKSPLEEKETEDNVEKIIEKLKKKVESSLKEAEAAKKYMKDRNVISQTKYREVEEKLKETQEGVKRLHVLHKMDIEDRETQSKKNKETHQIEVKQLESTILELKEANQNYKRDLETSKILLEAEIQSSTTWKKEKEKLTARVEFLLKFNQVFTNQKEEAEKTKKNLEEKLEESNANYTRISKEIKAKNRLFLRLEGDAVEYRSLVERLKERVKDLESSVHQRGGQFGRIQTMHNEVEVPVKMKNDENNARAKQMFADGKKEQGCRFFKQGLCRNGNACPFGHETGSKPRIDSRIDASTFYRMLEHEGIFFKQESYSNKLVRLKTAATNLCIAYRSCSKKDAEIACFIENSFKFITNCEESKVEMHLMSFRLVEIVLMAKFVNAEQK